MQNLQQYYQARHFFDGMWDISPLSPHQEDMRHKSCVSAKETLWVVKDIQAYRANEIAVYKSGEVVCGKSHVSWFLWVNVLLCVALWYPY